MISRRTLLAAIAALAAAPAFGADRIKVVASFSILADLARQVGGDRVEVAALVGPNGDAHVYAPTPADAKTLAAARLVVVNGLGFEGWMDRLVQASGTKAAVAVASTGVRPRRSEGGDTRAREAVDPHAWQAVANAKVYVANIRDALAATDPAGKSAYQANAAAYLAELDALDAEMRTELANIPADRRRIITTHDAFGYFAAAYGITFIAPQGVNTESEASARDIATIITHIRQQKIPAVFLENITDPPLLARIARETGAKIGGALYSDALTDADGEAPTYLQMMRHNVRQLVTALAN